MALETPPNINYEITFNGSIGGILYGPAVGINYGLQVGVLWNIS